LAGENYKLFCLVWEKIAAGVMYDEWTVLFVKDTGAEPGLVGGRIFREFARGIFDSNEIGIVEFTPDMFLFKDDWAPANIFGPPPDDESDPELGQLEKTPGLFDDDLDSWRESAIVSHPIP
jgi:hypothetical protein